MTESQILEREAVSVGEALDSPDPAAFVAWQASKPQFKPIADFEWSWPTKIERDIIERALTLDFISSHWSQVEPLFGSGAGASIAARFFDNGADRAMAARLQAFVAAHVPAATRARIDKNLALIRERADVREQRLPQADRWIAEAR